VLVLRGGALGLGAALLSVVLLRPALAWVPLTSFALVTWLCGSKDLAGTARWWAVLSQPATSTSSALVAAALWLLGAVCYVVADARAE
jgi:hypothetical protein